MARNIMVAVDGTPHSRDALDFAARNLLLAAPRDADELHLVMVRPPIKHAKVPAGGVSGEQASVAARPAYRRIVGLVFDLESVGQASSPPETSLMLTQQSLRVCCTPTQITALTHYPEFIAEGVEAISVSPCAPPGPRPFPHCSQPTFSTALNGEARRSPIQKHCPPIPTSLLNILPRPSAYPSLPLISCTAAGFLDPEIGRRLSSRTADDDEGAHPPPLPIRSGPTGPRYGEENRAAVGPRARRERAAGPRGTAKDGGTAHRELQGVRMPG